MIASHPGIWGERRRRQLHAPFQWEWYDLLLKENHSRLALIAPREHSKSTSITEDYGVWYMRYHPGCEYWCFSASGDLANEMKTRIDRCVEETEPEMWERRKRPDMVDETTYGNGARLKVAGAGKTIRGPHPDLIVGDDVLDEKTTTSSLARGRTKRWWIATIGGMCHGGTTRRVGSQYFPTPATRVVLTGTPFHGDDLIMALKLNVQYHWYRYAAELEAPQPGGHWWVEAG